LAAGTNGQVITLAGGVPTWATPDPAGITITDDTTTNSTRYITFTSVTTGSITGENVSSTKLQYNPSTGVVTATGFAGALNGTVGATTPTTATFTDVTLNGQGDLRFADSDSSNWVAFQAPSTVASNVTWTLPNADGTNGQVLSTNGSGVLSWASAGGGSGFPSGTKMLFQQTAAPTGWTKDTTHDNKALRVVSGTVGSGGSVAFTTAFASQAVSGSIGNTTLTTSQIPSHTHNLGGNNSTGQGIPTRGWDRADGRSICLTDATNVQRTSANGGTIIYSEGGGGSHNHTFTGTAINLAVQYVDLIIATKD
jgi:hypothetical protein